MGGAEGYDDPGDEGRRQRSDEMTDLNKREEVETIVNGIGRDESGNG